MRKYSEIQVGRTLVHHSLPQPSKDGDTTTESTLAFGKNDIDGKYVTQTEQGHTFIVCADSQLGMTSSNKEWETELEYSRKAIHLINELNPRPLFCCMCGDLVDMDHTFFAGKGGDFNTKDECDKIQHQQRKDFQEVWSGLHEDIALVCICGNHDIGNRPTKVSIDSFKSYFGDDYLAFWNPAGDSYNIVMNTNLFSDPSGAPDLYETQLEWLEERLKYARSKEAKSIFVFGHHPWFLYDEGEDAEGMTGYTPFLTFQIRDSYFHISKERRSIAMKLFKEHKVTAAFAGHFHQNLVAKSSFGMEMIITSSLSCLLESTGRPKDFDEPQTRGIRVVTVPGDGTFQHQFVSLPDE
jgi:hypothetical protein